MTIPTQPYTDREYNDARGTHNVVLRLEHLWSQHRTTPCPCTRVALHWQFARDQLGATFLTQYIEDTILRWVFAEQVAQ